MKFLTDPINKYLAHRIGYGAYAIIITTPEIKIYLDALILQQAMRLYNAKIKSLSTQNVFAKYDEFGNIISFNTKKYTEFLRSLYEEYDANINTIFIIPTYELAQEIQENFRIFNKYKSRRTIYLKSIETADRDTSLESEPTNATLTFNVLKEEFSLNAFLPNDFEARDHFIANQCFTLALPFANRNHLLDLRIHLLLNLLVALSIFSAWLLHYKFKYCTNTLNKKRTFNPELIFSQRTNRQSSPTLRRRRYSIDEENQNDSISPRQISVEEVNDNFDTEYYPSRVLVSPTRKLVTKSSVRKKNEQMQLEDFKKPSVVLVNDEPDNAVDQYELNDLQIKYRESIINKMKEFSEVEKDLIFDLLDNDPEAAMKSMPLNRIVNFLGKRLGLEIECDGQNHFTIKLPNGKLGTITPKLDKSRTAKGSSHASTRSSVFPGDIQVFKKSLEEININSQNFKNLLTERGVSKNLLKF